MDIKKEDAEERYKWRRLIRFSTPEGSTDKTKKKV